MFFQKQQESVIEMIKVNKASYIQIFNHKKILVIAPHPDDEIVGCGGTVCKCVDYGASIMILHLNRIDDKEVNVRKLEAKSVAAELGVSEYKILNNTIQEEEIPKRILESIRSFNPSLILLPHLYDKHIEHCKTNFWLVEAIKKDHCSVEQVALYEIWDTLTPNTLINISDYMDKKDKLIHKYKSQIEKYDFIDLAKSLTHYRLLSCPPKEAAKMIAINEYRYCRRHNRPYCLPWTNAEAFCMYGVDDYISYIEMGLK